MKVISLVVLMLSCMTALAQRNITGLVFDAVTNEPLDNARVFVPVLQRGVYTQQDGSFALRNLPAGRILVEVTHVGYQSVFSSFKIQGDTSLLIHLEPAVVRVQEVVVTGNYLSSPHETSLNIAQVSADKIASSSYFNVADAVAGLPGVYQLSTGPGISKPVIRGLSGTRIQVVANGLRFDNQQWQDEHGLGIATAGIDRIEVIKGPASVLYGSDALGGVVNIIDERPAPDDSTQRDLSVQLFGNTYGFSLQGGQRTTSGGKWKRFRAALDSHADYQDGNGSRVLNSRFSTFNVKAAWGKQQANAAHALSLAVSHSLFGFVFDSLNRKIPDDRWSRAFDGPHHSVSFVQLNSEHTWFRQDREIKFNIGGSSNLRLEDEGGGGISLSMLLNTVNSALQINRLIHPAISWSYGSSALLQTNTNFGGRVIVPDAFSGELSAFSYLKWTSKHDVFVDAGLRTDFRYLQTYATRTLNIPGNDSPTQEILPMTRKFPAANFSIGAGYHLEDGFGMRANVSTGYRPGNLAELSSNGLHEGTMRWEIGLLDSKIEQNLNAEVGVQFSSAHIFLSGSIYRNSFRNFFFLAPTGDEFFGFQVYRFRQSDAVLQGGELQFDLRIPETQIKLSSAFSTVRGEQREGQKLPMMPADRFTHTVEYVFRDRGILQTTNAGLSVTQLLPQSRPAEFETKTPGYFILSSNISTSLRRTTVTLNANNLLNRQYIDHLSRYKYFGIASMGRMVSLSIQHKF